MDLKGLRKWSITVIGVSALVGLAAMTTFHGMTDFQLKMIVGAVVTLTSTGTGVQAFLDFLDKQKGG